mmetsp:Transcript_40866/g.161894  ORF Transcript_40866/g.161894 Transcript_40866/m.161894 type:complete len:95 (+) Transcript_40866:1161-1445(+)
MDRCTLKHPNEKAVTLEGPAGVICVTCSRIVLTDEYALSSMKVGTAMKLKLACRQAPMFPGRKSRGFATFILLTDYGTDPGCRKLGPGTVRFDH